MNGDRQPDGNQVVFTVEQGPAPLSEPGGQSIAMAPLILVATWRGDLDGVAFRATCPIAEEGLNGAWSDLVHSLLEQVRKRPWVLSRHLLGYCVKAGVEVVSSSTGLFPIRLLPPGQAVAQADDDD